MLGAVLVGTLGAHHGGAQLSGPPSGAASKGNAGTVQSLAKQDIHGLAHTLSVIFATC